MGGRAWLTPSRPELSNEIRGERLRFVEAMKEATTINVQSAFVNPWPSHDADAYLLH